MSTKYLYAAAFVTALSAPASAMAEGPGYTYIEAGFVSAEPSGTSAVQGFDFNVSKSITDKLHVVAGQWEVTGSGDKFTTSTALLGWNHALNDRTDVVTRIGYIRERFRTGATVGSNDGIMYQLGARSMITDAFEFNGAVFHSRVAEANTGAGFGVRYWFRGALSVGLNFDFSEDLTLLRSGLRFNF